MTNSDVEPVGGRASEAWSKAYAAFLGLIGLIALILLARGLYLVIALLAVAGAGAAVLMRWVRRCLR